MPELESVRFGRWRISCDAETTRRAYASVATGRPEECACQPCLNFAAARGQIYPLQVLTLFEKLGIPPSRGAEVYHMARLSSRKHLYGGWFHLVGSILSGGDVRNQIRENLWREETEEVSENFSLGFSFRLVFVRGAFAGLPLVQLEFTAKVPWVLQATEPS